VAEPAPFVVRHAAPDSLLLGVDGPLQALHPDCAASADGLRLLDLTARCWASPDRKEQLGILIAASTQLTPVHALPPNGEPSAISLAGDGWTPRWSSAETGSATRGADVVCPHSARLRAKAACGEPVFE
jgi:hypothetical protein